MRIPLLFAILFLAAACSQGGGTRVSDGQLAGFQEGKTTAAEIISALGRPTTDIRDSSGLRLIGYSYVHTEVGAGAFVPIAGPALAHASSQARTVIFTFDAAGVLTKRTVSDSQYGG